MFLENSAYSIFNCHINGDMYAYTLFVKYDNKVDYDIYIIDFSNTTRICHTCFELNDDLHIKNGYLIYDTINKKIMGNNMNGEYNVDIKYTASKIEFEFTLSYNNIIIIDNLDTIYYYEEIEKSGDINAVMNKILSYRNK